MCAVGKLFDFCPCVKLCAKAKVVRMKGSEICIFEGKIDGGRLKVESVDGNFRCLDIWSGEDGTLYGD